MQLAIRRQVAALSAFRKVFAPERAGGLPRGIAEPGDVATKRGAAERQVLICRTLSTAATFTPLPVDSDAVP